MLDGFSDDAEDVGADGGVVLDLGVGLEVVRVELRLRIRGLDDRDADALGAQLVVEGLGVALDGVLARRAVASPIPEEAPVTITTRC